MARRADSAEWRLTPPAVDRLVLGVTGVLLVFGVIMVYSASSAVAAQEYGDAGYFLKRQLLWGVFGLIAMCVLARMNVHSWQRLAVPMLLLTILLLVLVLLPDFGTVVNGARRWFRIGAFSIQPSEMAKLVVVCYLARYLAKHGERISDFRRGLLPPLVIVGVVVALVLAEPDLGTAAVIVLLAAVMLFMGQARLSHLGALSLALVPIVVYLVVSSPYRRQRFLAFLNPWDDAQASGFQIIQSFLAMGQGGWFGAGLGESRQKLFFLPEPHTDFIYSVIGEEFGLIGSLAVLGLFAIFLWRGFAIACAAEEPFVRQLGVGVTTMIGLQALLHIAVVTGMVPTKGLTLPFISYGGSSLFINLMAVGILLSISRQRVTG